MATTQESTNRVSTLFDSCLEYQSWDGIPSRARALLIHGLASAVAGGQVVYSAPPDQHKPTYLPLLFCTGDDRLPFWIKSELEVVMGQHEWWEQCVLKARSDPEQSLDFKARVDMTAAVLCGPGIAKAMAKVGKPLGDLQHRSMIPLYRPGRGRQAPDPAANGRVPATAVAGLDAVAKCLRELNWSAGASIRTTRMLGWINTRDLAKLASRIRPEVLGSSVWIVDAPAQCEANTKISPPLYSPRGDALLTMNLSRSNQSGFEMPELWVTAARALNRIIAKRVQRLPECLRHNAIPDDDLALHATFLTAILHQNPIAPYDDKTTNAIYFNCFHMVSNTVNRHLHWMRMTYPCDERGSFDPTDIAIYRQLHSIPRRHRDIQRSMRGVYKADVIRGLDRATAAGVAWEPQPGLFALSPPPRAQTIDELLSEIKSEIKSEPLSEHKVI
jgi:hypothetical protein